jgi:hypothetical protein
MRFDRDPGAKALWEAVYPQLTEARAGLFGSVTSRAEAQTFRLSLIYALLDYKPGDDLLIREPHVAAALAAWWYCEGSAQIIFGDSTGDERADVALECLQNSEAGVLSRTEVGLAVFGKHSTKPKLDAVRNLLERHDRISVEMCPTSGRPVEMWFLRARMLGGA